MALLSARARAARRFGGEQQQLGGRLVAYASKQAHSSAERAAMLGGVTVRLLDTDERFSLRGGELEKAVREDREKVRETSIVVSEGY